MYLRRALTVSLLLFLIVKVGVAGDLVCHCTNSMDPWCHLYGEVDCPEPYMCAVIYDKYPHINVPNPQAMCSNRLEPGACSGALNNATRFIACCEDHMCNDHNFVVPVYADPTTTEPSAPTTVITDRTPRATDAIAAGGPSTGNMRLYFGISIGLPVFLVAAVLFLLLLTYLYYCHLKEKVRLDSLPKKWDLEKPPSLSVNFDFKDTIPTTTEEGTNSSSLGSGSGLPLLTQRTVARSIKLGERIGSGRFGQVFVGDYQGDKVAVKKFVSHDDKSWARETEIYNTVYLINESILGFFASDMVSNNGATELWLITHYHPNGSLHDYLSREVISKDIVVRMVSSCCNGLSHLHTEFPGTTGKPAIAHRDIKSRNILVKQNLECCIADFGLAVMKDASGLSLPTNPRQGTKRYMAPEILDESMNMEQFESFKRADIYSLGLVMWEICRRCVLKDGTALDYQLPFQGLVSADPSFEDMKKLIVVEKTQLPIHDEWQKDAVLQMLARTMQECWHYEAAARPTAANRKKRMARLLSVEQNGNSVPVKLVTCASNT